MYVSVCMRPCICAEAENLKISSFRLLLCNCGHDRSERQFVFLLLCFSSVAQVMFLGTLSLLNVPLAAFLAVLFVPTSLVLGTHKPRWVWFLSTSSRYVYLWDCIRECEHLCICVLVFVFVLCVSVCLASVCWSLCQPLWLESLHAQAHTHAHTHTHTRTHAHTHAHTHTAVALLGSYVLCLLSPLPPPPSLSLSLSLSRAIFHFLQCAVVLATMFPPCILAMATVLKNVLTSSGQPVQSMISETWVLWHDTLTFHHLLGVWLFPIACFLWPVSLLFWCFLWLRFKSDRNREHPQEHEKKEWKRIELIFAMSNSLTCNIKVHSSFFQFTLATLLSRCHTPFRGF